MLRLRFQMVQVSGDLVGEELAMNRLTIETVRELEHTLNPSALEWSWEGSTAVVDFPMLRR